jgi:serine/threonine protein kinase/DNA-binding winged helix-turn-helix (wHTH) protein
LEGQLRLEQSSPAAGPQRAAQRRIWRFGRISLDERSHELLIDGVEAELERKPLEVLIYLLQHAGEICTKDELLANVWPGRILSETALTKCVGRLREVLGDDSQSIIKTAHGFGYRFVAPVKVELIQGPEPPRFDFRPGDHPPGRPLWSLVERLGVGGHGEAWRGHHEKTREQRVFKFALDEASLAALKREITLFRVINDTLGSEARVVKLLDWNLAQQPYFIEAEYLSGGSLLGWAQGRNGLGSVALGERIGIAATIADALATVHGVGVLHKDLKPSNVLVEETAAGVDIKLADFGSGGVLDPAELERLGITRLGFTRTVAFTESNSGTPMYLAPEVLGGQPFTVRSDIYALGIMLYQLIAGDFRKLMSSGWERDVADDLLREDIAAATAGDPATRLADAAELARRLRSLEQRHQQRQKEREAQLRAQRAQRALEQARARRLGLTIAFAILLLGFAVSSYLFLRARAAQQRAEQAVATAQAVSGFLSNDLFGSIDLSKRSVRDLTVQEVLKAGAAQIDVRFKDAPDIAGDLHAALGSSYWNLDLEDSKTEFSSALQRYEAAHGLGYAPTLVVLTQMLNTHYAPADYAGVAAHAEAALAAARQRYGEGDSKVLQLRYRLAMSRYLRGDWVRAAQELVSVAQDMDRYAPALSHFDGSLTKSLGLVLLKMADFGNAEHWLRQAQSEAEKAGASTGDLPVAIHLNLGALLCETQRFTAADQELAIAAQIAGRLLEDDSRYPMLIRQDLGQLRLEQGRPAEAAAVLEQVLRTVAASRTTTDREFSAQMRYYLGLAYQAQRHLPEAAEMLRGAVERGKASDGPDYPTTLQMQIGLADVLREQGQPDQAQALLDQVAASGFPGLPKDHPIAAEQQRVQGLLLLQRNEHGPARAALAEALRIYAARYGAAHWRSLRARQELAAAG